MASQPKAQTVQATAHPVQASSPPSVNLTTTGYGNQGYQLPADPASMGSTAAGMGTGPPAWAQGHFAMPWWGQAAPNVGQAIMQANPSMYGPYNQAPAPAPVQQTPTPAHSYPIMITGYARGGAVPVTINGQPGHLSVAEATDAVNNGTANFAF
jgi:hypothetical protein